MKKISIDSIFSNIVFLLSALFSFVGIIGNILGTSKLFSISLAFNIVLMLLWVGFYFVFNLIDKKKLILKEDFFVSFILIIISGILLFISCFYKADFSYLKIKYFYKALASFCFILQIILITHTNIFQSFRKIIIFISMILVLSFLLLYIFRFRTQGSKATYFGTSNPNEASIYLTVFGILSLFGFVVFSNLLLKYSSVISFIIAFVLVVITGSRNSIAAIIICLSIFLAYSFFKKLKPTKYFNAILTLSPLFVLLIYLIIAYLFITSTSSAYGVKSVSTRKAIWDFYFGFFLDSPIIGNYFKAVVSIPLDQGLGLYTITQAHGTAIDTLFTYGIGYFIVQSVIIFRLLNKKRLNDFEDKKYKLSPFSYSFGLIFLFLGFFEAGIYLCFYCAITILLLSTLEPVLVKKNNGVFDQIYFYAFDEHLYFSAGGSDFCYASKNTLIKNVSKNLIYWWLLIYAFLSNKRLHTNCFKSNKIAICEETNEQDTILLIDCLVSNKSLFIELDI